MDSSFKTDVWNRIRKEMKADGKYPIHTYKLFIFSFRHVE
jgi:hypothetical protein